MTKASDGLALLALALPVRPRPVTPAAADLLRCVAKGWTLGTYANRRGIGTATTTIRDATACWAMQAPTTAAAVYSAIQHGVITIPPERPRLRITQAELAAIRAVALGWTPESHDRFRLGIPFYGFAAQVARLVRRAGCSTAAHLVARACAQGYLTPETPRG